MHKITNRQKRVFIIAAVPHPTDEGKELPAIVINPGYSKDVPTAQWNHLRQHSAQIFDHLVEHRLLIVDSGILLLSADELQNVRPALAPDDLAIDPHPSEGVTLERKGVTVETIELPDGDGPAEVKRGRK